MLSLAVVAIVRGDRPQVDGGETALSPRATPKIVTVSDPEPVELGMRFSSARDGTVDSMRFYKGPENTGTHTGSLWDESGSLLARTTFTDESPSGWQTAQFRTPVPIRAGKSYVVSYYSPAGQYSADAQGFDSALARGNLSMPAGAGVYTYGGGFPEDNHLNANYFVDIHFTEGEVPSSPAPRQATTTPRANSDKTLPLPRIPWEGGPSYWKQFPAADAAGWDEPDFFPILAWFNSFSNDEEVQYDKTLGINTYSGMWEGTPYSLFENNGVFWIGGPLNDTFSESSKNWVGNFLDDEVDGRFTPEQGRDRLQKSVDENAGNGRFNYANFTQMVMGTDLPTSDAEAFINDYTDVVSIDMYWYTIPYCSLLPYRDVYITPVKQSNCRTASSYGKTMESLRTRDAADGKLQPMWQWIENLNGGPGGGEFTAHITGGQLQGAVMNSLIHEARGIAYFNQSLNGPCQSGNVFRQSQVVENFCGAEQIEAAKTINTRIAELAPVLNSQSYDYSFGAGTDTMLKTHDGDAYIFAMIDGKTQPGERTFTVPPGVTGTTLDVLFEDRTIEVDSSGRFTDTFADEYSYHIYRVAQ
ncbi:hypothetical protein GCM10011313_13270 [Mycetocola zhadangensis]|nr:hypothetical protein GCM10011313_13270 [Mycetocola zhadangensis]